MASKGRTDVTNGDLIAALQTPGSIQKKATALNVSPTVFYIRAARDPLVREALELWRQFPRLPYPTMIQPPPQVGDWVVLERVRGRQGTSHWRVQHKCGSVRVISGSELVRNAPKTCAACRRSMYQPGDRVGAWEVLCRTEPTRVSRCAFWKVKHVPCGTVRTLTSGELKTYAKRECQRCRKRNGYHKPNAASKAWKNGA